MSYIQLDNGFVMDEDSKEIFRIKNGVMLESSVNEYERLNKFITNKRSLWSDATEVSSISDDSILDDESGNYFSVTDEDVSVYRADNLNEQFLEPTYHMICITDLEDLTYSGLQGRAKALVLKLLGLVEDYKNDGEWHNEICDWNRRTYKIAYKIDSGIMISVKKIVKGAPVRVKRKASAMLDF